jgi:hypothetical protein
MFKVKIHDHGKNWKVYSAIYISRKKYKIVNQKLLKINKNAHSCMGSGSVFYFQKDKNDKI